MKTSLNKIIVAIVFLMTTSIFAKDIISFGKYNKSEFTPARGQSFKIPFNLNQNAQVSIDIYAPDGDKIRTLTSKKELSKGKFSLSWDGKDSEGIVVPDEAYTVVLKAKYKNKITTVDPRLSSGGEIETDLQTNVTSEGKTIYNLSKPSRVLIRTGIVDGPMMRSLLNWVPKSAGKNVQHWNGFDKDKVVDVISTRKYGVVVIAFALSDYSIITTGNEKLDYATYYKSKNWVLKPIAKDKQFLEREDKGISPHFYKSRITDKDPKIDIEFPKNVAKDKNGIAILQNNRAIAVKVTMPREDEKFISQSKYEVSFFVDYEFKSEEELGFMPITWLWSPNGFSKGEHILTVNISGFAGQVGVKNIKFIIN